VKVESDVRPLIEGYTNFVINQHENFLHSEPDETIDNKTQQNKDVHSNKDHDQNISSTEPPAIPTRKRTKPSARLSDKEALEQLSTNSFKKYVLTLLY
ncbi:MAG: hypothetical protein MHPSP_003883, partial [Paramarteilia canceri]